MDEKKGPFYTVETMSEAPYSDLAQGIVDRKGMHVGSVTIKIMGGQAIAIKFTEEATLTPHAPKVSEEVDPRQLTIYQHNSDTEKVADDMDDELKEKVAKGLAGLWRTLNGLHMLPAKHDVAEISEEAIKGIRVATQEWIDNVKIEQCPICEWPSGIHRLVKLTHLPYCESSIVVGMRFDLGWEPGDEDLLKEHEAFEAWLQKQAQPENEGLTIEVKATA